ncbi:flagellin [Thermococcus stetteri]|uniref:flagellin n=1 Tax=Thermococcus stetteri TaxID=49900 RepID=UPI001AEB74F3|nr:flagellin [Thermococcus stetteri]MBP1910942.1 flagellar protein FlaF [Thermococcus stetteri]
MGFSVSASAAIIFISFLIAASTLYTAWDNTYTTVQAAREEWYDLKLSQLNTNVDLNSTLGLATLYRQGTTVVSYDLTLYIHNFGSTLYAPYWSGVYDGKFVTLYDINDDNVGFAQDYTYVLPGEDIELNITNITADSTLHNLTLTFENGCWLRISWYYNTNGQSVYIEARGKGCPTEVS